MRLLLLLLRTSRWDATVGILAGVVAGLATSGFAWVLQGAIADQGAHWPRYAAAFIACWLAYGAGSVLADNRLSRVAQRAVRELRLSLSRRIIGVPLPRLEHEQQRIFPVLIEDVAAVSRAAENLPSALTGLMTVTGCFVLLAVISLPLAAASLALVAVAIIGYVLPLQRFQRHLARWRADWDRLGALLDAIVHGHKELQLDDRKRAAFLDQHLAPVCLRQEAEMVRASTWETLIRRWGELLLLLGIGALLFTLPLHGWATYEQFGRFLFVALFLLAPLATLVGFSSYLARVNLALDRASQLGLLLDAAAPALPDHRAEPATAPSSQLRFALSEVTYRHHRDNEAPFDLGPISLAFDRPEVVFICGGNGSGKTTLLKLLCGLYPPEQGQLLADGRVLGAAELARHRRRFGVIFADFFLFSGLLGHEDAPADEAARLLREVHLDKQVAIGAAGVFSTTKLSQGQRKRLALVAALLEDKPVYIFDEWAADQDPEFRRWYYERILPGLRARGKLVLAITHDEAFFPQADRIVHLAEGRIVSDTRPPAAAKLPMTLHLVCYAAGDRIHFLNQAALAASARRHGVVSILARNADTLGLGFAPAHPALFAEREGAGYWLWKPRIILDALERAAPGDLVVYADAGADLRGPLEPLAAAAQGRDGVLFWNDYPNRMHVKRDAFVLTGTDQTCYHDARQLDAAFLVFRNHERVRAFVRLWLEHCTDPRQLTDQPNTCGQPDLPGFVQHRHDQSLLTLLYLRERVGLDFKTLARRLKHRHFRHHRRRASWQPIWLWHAFHDGGEAALDRTCRRWRVVGKKLRRLVP